ncbi:hypothetical protein K7472_07965 [Streptomyces sp. PTM05]|uniref:Uncharacterized protein n=1 Tax=Streptantibioticus parmotrematis TaxID=2873249 RepID=A0ABS7QNM3_9ACTN|nr:hypothetical protein [Streptantibioticus parmotrematis]MBY8884780.1 hypothetical protein [Streptantibioticus parmotrematis]
MRLTQLGPGPAWFFRDACELMVERPTRVTVTHLVSHLLREVESGLRAVISAFRAPGVAGHEASILAVLQALDIDHMDPIATTWLEMAGANSRYNLARRAHRDGLGAPHAIDDEFRSFFNAFEILLDRVLEEFESRYDEVVQQVDALIALEQPTVAHARQVRQSLPQDPATQSRFFGGIGPQWLEPLVSAGFFLAPLPPQPYGDGGLMRLDMWPESSYIARIAANQPQAAVTAAMNIPHSKNARVNGDIVSVGLAVPAEYGQQLVDRVVTDIRTGAGVTNPLAVGELATQLAGAGYSRKALDLLGALLEKVPSGGRAAAMQAWYYAELLRKHVPAMVETVGTELLAVLRDRLRQVVTEDDGRWTRYSTTWRPSVAGTSEHENHDPTDALFSAVRDVAIALVEHEPASSGTVLGVLDAGDSVIFQRIALHVLAERGDEARDLVADRLLNPKLLRNRAHDAEYNDLAQRRANLLSRPELAELLALIDSGPDLDDQLARYTSNTGIPPSQAERDSWLGTWQRDRLALLREVLPAPWVRRYETLVSQFGEPLLPRPQNLVWTFASVPPAPVVAGDLAARPTNELVEYLRTWQPPTGGPVRWDGESLDEPLRTAIEQDARRRSAEAAAFIGLPAHYVTAVLGGLENAARQDTDLDWPGIVPLLAWADEQAVAELDDPIAGSRLWKEARKSVMRLVRLGMAEPASSLRDVQDTLWTLIQHAIADPDPTPADEEQQVSGGTHPEFVSMNTVRPVAINAAIDWGTWEQSDDPNADLSRLFTVVDEHLEVWADPSRSVRWVLGARFAELIRLDREQAAARAARLFPLDVHSRAFWAAAWNGYLGRVTLDPDVWSALHSQYEVALQRLDPDATDDESLYLATHLGWHLVHRYCVGSIDLAGPDSLLHRYYDRAPVSVRAHLLERMGYGLVDISKATADRLAGLLDQRLVAVQGGGDATELRGFGWWFSSGAFEDGWAVRRLRDVLTHTALRGTDDRVLTRLASIAPRFPADSLAALEAWARTEPSLWFLTRDEDSIREVLLASRHLSTDRLACGRTRTIVSRLLRSGLDLRDIHSHDDVP